jgi:hypothetical protein
MSRRLEPRKILICRISVSWEDQAGLPAMQVGLLEDRSLSGVGLCVPKPIAVGTKVKIRGRRRELAGIVQHCRPEGTEYFIGVRLDERDLGWAGIGAGL